mmetsp:Transcript_17478/g.43944  ORF Transcript_17478/g.43944 Transcript_17478/m.43944 type:complete len:158 (-) Transcript_17478:513-986(-)
MMSSCLPLIILFSPATAAYGRPAVLQCIQPLRWASDAFASILLKPELVVGVDLAVLPSPGRGQVSVSLVNEIMKIVSSNADFLACLMRGAGAVCNAVVRERRVHKPVHWPLAKLRRVFGKLQGRPDKRRLHFSSWRLTNIHRCRRPHTIQRRALHKS